MKKTAGLKRRMAVACGILVLLPVHAPAQPVQPTGQIDFSMRADGLYPKDITIAPGKYSIIFTNGVFRVPLNLTITQSGATSVIAQTTSTTAIVHRQRFKVTLANGQYVAQVVGYPAWSTTITVTTSGESK